MSEMKKYRILTIFVLKSSKKDLLKTSNQNTKFESYLLQLLFSKHSALISYQVLWELSEKIREELCANDEEFYGCDKAIIIILCYNLFLININLWIIIIYL